MEKHWLDASVIKKLKNGDKAAQERFYDQFAPKLLALCSRYLADPKEAEDAMIQSLLKALQRISTFKAEGSLEAWVKRIAINECLTLLKKNVLFNVVSLNDIAEDDEDFICEDVDAEYLLRYIADLPSGYRAVFNLYAVEGYAHSEIAEMLGISVSTSKSQLCRARTLLQKKLKNYNQKNISNE
ncbi:MAG: RNA polymerase sigma factor [Thermaurantimonas sp.]